MDLYAKIVVKIIEQQEAIIGPVAVEQAQLVNGLTLDWPNHQVTLSGDGVSVVDKLVAQYKTLFGQISVEVCREAAAKLLPELPAAQQPKSLQ